MPASDAPQRADFLLLGGGLASATAAEALRLEGAKGSIVIVSAEPGLPYQRPPLSKRILLSGVAGELAPVLTAGDYRDLDIQLLRSTRALSVDAQGRTVATDRAGQFGYGKLLIATGARPLRLHLPGSELPRIHSLRDVADALALHAVAHRGARAVVIGASFIGMEVTTTLHKLGVHVTLLAQHGRIFDTLQAPAISRFFFEQCASRGVEVCEGEPVAFEGGDHVRAVVTTHGQRLPCDFVVTGIGVAPEVRLLEGSGIALADGVVVDERLQSNVPDVFAAGDAAAFFDPVFRVRRRGEHWDNAVKQGKLAAKNMLGQRLPLDEVSAFFCEELGTSFQFLGVPEGASGRLELGSHDTRSWGLVYLQREIPRALFTSGRHAGDPFAHPPPHAHRPLQVASRAAGLLDRVHSQPDGSDPAGRRCAGCVRRRCGARSSTMRPAGGRGGRRVDRRIQWCDHRLAPALATRRVPEACASVQQPVQPPAPSQVNARPLRPERFTGAQVASLDLLQARVDGDTQQGIEAHVELHMTNRRPSQQGIHGQPPVSASAASPSRRTHAVERRSIRSAMAYMTMPRTATTSKAANTSGTRNDELALSSR